MMAKGRGGGGEIEGDDQQGWSEKAAWGVGG